MEVMRARQGAAEDYFDESAPSLLNQEELAGLK